MRKESFMKNSFGGKKVNWHHLTPFINSIENIDVNIKAKESDTTERLHFHFSFHALEKGMATHSSVLAWRIPGMGEPDGLPSGGSRRVRHDWSDLAAAAANTFGKQTKENVFTTLA